MAFCTTCGSQMDANAHFCTKCGKAVTPAGAAPVATAAATGTASAPAPSAPVQTYPPQAAAPPSGGTSALKIVLIILGIFVFIGILSAAGLVYTAYRVKKAVHITADGKTGSIDFGGIKASANSTSARDLARKIGVDLYPGATQSGDSTEAQFGNMTTASIKLTTSDSVQKVADFYKSRYSNAMVTTTENGKFSLVGDDKAGGTLTISAEDEGGATKIEIVKVGGLKIEVK